MIKFMNDVIVKASKTIRKNIKEGKGVPTRLVMMDSNGNSHKLSKKEVAGLFEARNVFILKNGRLPNYVTLNSTRRFVQMIGRVAQGSETLTTDRKSVV